MKYLVYIFLALVLIAPMAGLAYADSAAAATTPTFSIVSVVQDKSVTILTKNFPANDSFDVLLGKIGTRGVKGIKVASTNSGSGGAFEATYTIPNELKGLAQIAIRLQSNTGSGYFSYNWFYNSTSGLVATATPGPTATPAPTQVSGGYKGFPTFTIVSATADTSVTILTNNLPPNDTFDVLMGKIGTLGVNGIKVATLSSGAGGAQTLTYSIPAQLKGLSMIALRLQSSSGSKYFAFNWFYNSNTGTSPTPVPGATPMPTQQPGYTGYPTFTVVKVVKDATVEIRITNLPPNDTFDVLMGKMGTLGVKGAEVGEFNSGAGGTQSFTLNIPDSLKGQSQIAVRIQSNSGSGYFAYNWFYNSTTP